MLSRIFAFTSGVIFGMVAGLAFAASLPIAKRAVLLLIGSAYAAVIGLAAWVGFGIVAPMAAADPSNAGLVFAAELLGALTIEAISTLPLVLLPFAGMDGAAIRSWKTVGMDRVLCDRGRALPAGRDRGSGELGRDPG